MMPDQPNIVFFHVDNLGYGELGCYGGGVLRGADTARIDAFAREGFRLMNYAPEAQCTPTRSALLTGRHSIRSGNHTVAMPGPGGNGLVAWERTLGDLFSEAGYATMCVGKWHIGDGPGRWPTDKGFDSWYGHRTATTRLSGSRIRGTGQVATRWRTCWNPLKGKRHKRKSS